MYSFILYWAGKEFAHNVGDLGLIPCVGKIPWRRERLPTPVFWPREFHGLSIHGVTKIQTQLSDFHLKNKIILCWFSDFLKFIYVCINILAVTRICRNFGVYCKLCYCHVTL